MISKRSTCSSAAFPLSGPTVASVREFIFSARLTMTWWTLVSGQPVVRSSLTVDRLWAAWHASVIDHTAPSQIDIYWWQALSTARMTIETAMWQCISRMCVNSAQWAGCNIENVHGLVSFILLYFLKFSLCGQFPVSNNLHVAHFSKSTVA